MIEQTRPQAAGASRPRIAGLLVLLVVPSACHSSSSDAPAPAPSASVSSAPPPAPPASSAPAPPPAPLELLRFTFASGVTAKEPVDQLLAAEPGMRVYAHLALRNTGAADRHVHLVFRVNDEKRTSIDLKVERSRSFRTWAFNTLKDSDKKGPLTVEITDDLGNRLGDQKLPIEKKRRLAP